MNNFRQGNNSRQGQGGFRSNDQFSGPREMHKAVCAGCQKECEVPFKPTEGREVFCRDCYRARKPSY